MHRLIFGTLGYQGFRQPTKSDTPHMKHTNSYITTIYISKLKFSEVQLLKLVQKWWRYRLECDKQWTSHWCQVCHSGDWIFWGWQWMSSRTVNGLHLACRSPETGWRSGTDSQGHWEYINEDVQQAIMSGCHLSLCSLNRSQSLLLHHSSTDISYSTIMAVLLTHLMEQYHLE